MQKNTIAHFFLTLALTIFSIIVPATAGLAQDNPGFNDGFEGVENIGQDSNISTFEGKPENFITKVVKGLLALVAVIAVAAIIWGGFMYITSIGNDSRIDKAKTIILYAVIGLLVIGAAAVAVNTILALFST